MSPSCPQFTAYVSGGIVHSICRGIRVENGTFNEDELKQFNNQTENRYLAEEILSHRTNCGHFYRIEYHRDSHMPCS